MGFFLLGAIVGGLFLIIGLWFIGGFNRLIRLKALAGVLLRLLVQTDSGDRNHASSPLSRKG